MVSNPPTAWALPYEAAQRLALMCDALVKGREVDRTGPASLLKHLPALETREPCGFVAPISGPYRCDSARGHLGKHHAVVGMDQYGYEVLWTTP